MSSAGGQISVTLTRTIRGPLQLDTNDVNNFPRWVRFEPDNEWDLEGVIVTLNPGDPSEVQLRKLAGSATSGWPDGR